MRRRRISSGARQTSLRPRVHVAAVRGYDAELRSVRHSLESDLGFSGAVYGFGAGVFFIAYFFLEVPSNLALHKFGARKWIARIMFTWRRRSRSPT